MIDQVCSTCKYYKDQKCNDLKVDIFCPEDFICDGYKQKRSGAFRRKMAKRRKEQK